MNWIFVTIDTILYIIIFVTVLYLFVFALFSMRNRKDTFKTAKKNHRIAVLFPSYREDRVIVASIESFLGQDYPRELYDVVVISDNMQPATNERLSQLPIRLFEATFENSSKAQAMNFAIDTLGDTPYDIVVILDADNTTETDFLTHINRAYANGIKAVQAHRRAKNRNTDTAVLDAISEEVNNSIFRKGHVNLGFSSALIGSGMAFDYGWFRSNIGDVSSSGEDKELEMLLLRQRIYIDYMDHVMVYDEKTQTGASFYNQRRRWIATQFETLGTALVDLPRAISSANMDYCDKMLQWMMLPNSVVLGIAIVMSIVVPVMDWLYAIKWWGVLVLMLFALSFATPDYLVDHRFYKAMRKLPLLTGMMALNLLRLRGAGKKFIHTDHSHDNNQQ